MRDSLLMPSLEYTLKDIKRIALDLMAEGGDCKIWLFYGNLGAGKTTLIKELGKTLGVEESIMSSPTFSLINEYETPQGVIFHMDFYRVKKDDEIFDLGIDEYFESGSYCFVEWPERLGRAMPQKIFKISLSGDGQESRRIEFQKYV